jgi:hypothetical protein
MLITFDAPLPPLMLFMLRHIDAIITPLPLMLLAPFSPFSIFAFAFASRHFIIDARHYFIIYAISLIIISRRRC